MKYNYNIYYENMNFALVNDTSLVCVKSWVIKNGCSDLAVFLRHHYGYLVHHLWTHKKKG